MRYEDCDDVFPNETVMMVWARLWPSLLAGFCAMMVGGASGRYLLEDLTIVCLSFVYDSSEDGDRYKACG
jgi:hypothetical protein